MEPPPRLSHQGSSKRMHTPRRTLLRALASESAPRARRPPSISPPPRASAFPTCMHLACRCPCISSAVGRPTSRPCHVCPPPATVHRPSQPAPGAIYSAAAGGDRLDAPTRGTLRRDEPRCDEPRCDEAQTRQFERLKTSTSVAPTPMSWSMMSGTSFVGTIAETATQSPRSSGKIEGDFLPGVILMASGST